MWNYYVILFLAVLCSADKELSNFDLENDLEYRRFLTNLVDIAKEHSGRGTSDYGLGSRMQKGFNDEQFMDIFDPVNDEPGNLPEMELSKRYVSDVGYGSRVAAGKHIADDKWAKDGLFGALGPGKRSGYFPIGSDASQILSKRLTSDTGYGSRVSAGQLVADDKWAKNGLFGTAGPGKRSAYQPIDDLTLPGLSKRFVTNHGYGSRGAAANNIADARWARNALFGTAGPEKRFAYQPEGDMILPRLSKRVVSDIGYGSRVAAGKNIADDKWAKEGLFGALGPGKRSGILRLGKRDGMYGDAGSFPELTRQRN